MRVVFTLCDSNHFRFLSGFEPETRMREIDWVKARELIRSGSKIVLSYINSIYREKLEDELGIKVFERDDDRVRKLSEDDVVIRVVDNHNGTYRLIQHTFE